MSDVDTNVSYLRRSGMRIQGNLLHGTEEQKLLKSLIFQNGALFPIATESEVQAIEPLEMSLMTTVSKLLSLTGKL
jgi:hypothetical protein